MIRQSFESLVYYFHVDVLNNLQKSFTEKYRKQIRKVKIIQC